MIHVIPLLFPILYSQVVKTILVPTDFSSAAESAIREGLPFLSPSGEACKILLLNTFPIPCASLDRSVAMHDEMKEVSSRRLEEERERLRKALASDQVHFELLACAGSLVNVVAYLSQERKVDCVLLGALRNGNDEERQKMLSRVACPVLIIPPQRLASHR